MRFKYLIFILAALVIMAGVILVISRRSSSSPASSQTSVSPEPSSKQSACRNFEAATLAIGERQLQVAVADAAAERSLGLSGCSAIPENSGMYFKYDNPDVVQYWMKDMLIPLDIVWIAGDQVVGIAQNVPVPVPGVSLQDLPQYSPPQPVTAVLEVKAGGTGEYDITVGSTVKLLPGKSS